MQDETQHLAAQVILIRTGVHQVQVPGLVYFIGRLDKVAAGKSRNTKRLYSSTTRRAKRGFSRCRGLGIAQTAFSPDSIEAKGFGAVPRVGGYGRRAESDRYHSGCGYSVFLALYNKVGERIPECVLSKGYH